MKANINEWIGREIADGRYKILGRIGQGSMGLVYCASDRHLNTEVVLKFPVGNDPATQSQGFLDRFRAETRSLVTLSHPHVVKIIDVGECEGLPYVVMQYLAGGSLKDRMATGLKGEFEPMGLGTLRDWLPDIARALDFIHSQNHIHRDVKPANILFDRHGNAFLGDFGIIKALTSDSAAWSENSATAPGFLVGTPNYVAPEVVMGRPADGRVDQYSLAMTIHEVLTGDNFMEGPTPSATVVNQTMVVPPPLTDVVPGVSDRVSDAILKGLSKDPVQRFATCAELAEEVLAGIPAGAVARQCRPRTAWRRAASRGRWPVHRAAPRFRPAESTPGQAAVHELPGGLVRANSLSQHAPVEAGGTPAGIGCGRSAGGDRRARRSDRARLVGGDGSRSATRKRQLDHDAGAGAGGGTSDRPESGDPMARPLRRGDSCPHGHLRSGSSRAERFFGQPRAQGITSGPLPTSKARDAANPGPVAAVPVEIHVAYGTEKKKWLEEATAEFEKTPAGQGIKVILDGMGSLEGAQAVLAGPKPVPIHVWSPASSAYRDLFEREWRTKHQNNPILKSDNLALTPMVFVMWEKPGTPSSRNSPGSTSTPWARPCASPGAGRASPESQPGADSSLATRTPIAPTAACSRSC